MDTAEIGKRTRQENRRLTWLAVKQNKASYLMIAPFMLFFLVFTIVPVLMSLPMGFTDFNMVQMPKFIGLSNYTTLFLADKVFIQSHSCYAGVCPVHRTDQLCAVLPAGVAHQ